MDLIKLKHYWIFIITLLFYCIGCIIHFIAQKNGTRPQKEKEILKKVSPSTVLFNSKNSNATVDTPENDYASPSNLFYFAQISDIHMSLDYNKGAQGHLLFFLKKMIPLLDPQFLFITGDIANSKKYGGMKVGTDENEWKMYHTILEKTDILQKNNGTFLWDLRGNHDCFMVPEWSSPYNYYRTYSKTKSRGFSFLYETSYGTYSFIGLDGCPTFTPSNPFFGIIDEVTMDTYTEFMDLVKTNKKNRHNFVFLHYPETTAKFGTSSTGKRWEDYTKDISLLLTGHFHNIIGDQIYAYHNNYLEIELSDFKLHGKYRIVSIDNDIVSFTDYSLPLPELPFDFKTSNVEDLINQPPWIFQHPIAPIVHITSPKNSRYILKTNREPVKESLTSGYVRVLVFSQQSPNDLKLSLFIDGKEQQVQFNYVGDQLQNSITTKKNNKRSLDTINIFLKKEKKRGETTPVATMESQSIESKVPPLWVARWQSTSYDDGRSHELKVVAFDSKTQLKGENTITFRMDGQKDDLDIPLRGQFLLKSVFPKLLPILFGIVYLSYEAIILFSRLYAVKYIIPNHDNLPFLPDRYIGDLIFSETKSFHETFFKKTFILPFIEAFTLNGIFYPLQILVIYMLVFPSRVGLMSRSSEHFSRFCGEFLYGFYGSGQWTNTYDQYGIFMATFLLVLYLDTLLIVFANHRHERNHLLTLIILSLICGFQLILSISTTYMHGGILTVLLSPFPVWIYVYCWFLLIMIIIRRFRSYKPVTPELAPIQI
ncbi:Metallo-dependent phosphatase [Neocallimastix lanati (nom. inval.)]|nr:Metallo-dependent phosphatase [Neocallimastix sp. JGI-2020a]